MKKQRESTSLVRSWVSFIKSFQELCKLFIAFYIFNQSVYVSYSSGRNTLYRHAIKIYNTLQHYNTKQKISINNYCYPLEQSSEQTI